ncbi:MAG: TIGR04086 family membrane protein [Oscillospiraceae bacterium]|nr:TIGR04086 family membrane protein [Oscillospiraceae bacterium]
MSDRAKNNVGLIENWAKPILFGLVTSAVVCAFVSLLISVVVALLKAFSEYAVIPLAVLALAAGVFAGAWIAGKIAKRRGLLVGIVIALLSFVVLLAAGLVSSSAALSDLSWIKFIVLLISGAAGGYCSMRQRRR